MHSKFTAANAAALMVQLVRRASANSQGLGLSDAQWHALSYFARANRHSRTLSGFSRYHATTLASASQTVSGLCARGLLERITDKIDRRRARFDVTPEGRELFESTDFDWLCDSIAGLEDDQAQQLKSLLNQVVSGNEFIDPDGCAQTCHGCGTFAEHRGPTATGFPFYCPRVEAQISESDGAGMCGSATVRTKG